MTPIRHILKDHLILIIPNEREIKKEERVVIKSCFKSIPDIEIFINKEEPRYIPIKEEEKKEEVRWLIKCLRHVEDPKTQDIIKRIIDKVIYPQV